MSYILETLKSDRASRHGYTMVCSDKKFSLLENRAGISRADIPLQILSSLIKLYKDCKVLEKITHDRAVNPVIIYDS